MEKEITDSPGISILLPTRGRTEQLYRSVSSLIDLADDAADIQWLFAFDNDDRNSYEYFQSNILPAIESTGALYTVMGFERLGYSRLNEYVNALALRSRGDWMVFWNDDAVMTSQSWDTVIKSYTGKFVLQAFDTHKKHPYSIFPIVPRKWLELIGHLSLHALNDAWLSQIAWMLDIVERIDVVVDHERFDLTGKNKDQTFKDRVIYEGNANDPRDFNYLPRRQTRFREADIIAKYLESTGVDMSHWHEIKAGKRNPWEKMMAADVNKQMTAYN